MSDILDLVRERKAAIQPRRCSERIRQHHQVVSDRQRYGGVWPRERFAMHGIDN
jgi:hypothetical protein